LTVTGEFVGVGDAEWRPGGDEPTPTMKLRRCHVATEIEALYAS
jgi:hypothetical protein